MTKSSYEGGGKSHGKRASTVNPGGLKKAKTSSDNKTQSSKSQKY